MREESKEYVEFLGIVSITTFVLGTAISLLFSTLTKISSNPILGGIDCLIVLWIILVFIGIHGAVINTIKKNERRANNNDSERVLELHPLR